MANFLFPTPYIPDPTSGRPVSSAKLYFGQPDLDPRILANQVDVIALQEDGTQITLGDQTVGKVFSIKAKVKNHSEYKERKQTNIGWVKILEKTFDETEPDV